MDEFQGIRIFPLFCFYTLYTCTLRAIMIPPSVYRHYSMPLYLDFPIDELNDPFLGISLFSYTHGRMVLHIGERLVANDKVPHLVTIRSIKHQTYTYCLKWI